MIAAAFAHALVARAGGVGEESSIDAGGILKAIPQLSAKPNFVMFFADDFGWGDLHSYGHPTQERGRIDEMAEQGIRFTQWYSSESLCTPSRAGLMTGRMPTRMGWPHSVFSPGKSESLPKDDLTIAEMLRPHGYVSGMAGKWHLGLNNKTKDDGVFLPFHRGFDEVGHTLPFSNHWACDESGRHVDEPDPKVCFLYKNTTLVQQPFAHANLTRTLVADATDWSNTSVNGIFGDQIREMDWAVGQVLDALKQHGFEQSTLAVFSSDHGPHVELCLEGGTAGPLRGGKGDSSWEGGLRVPGIMYWPGVIGGGQVSHELVSTMDVSMTFIHLASESDGSHSHGSQSAGTGGAGAGGANAGVGVGAAKIFDGRSLAPLFTGANTSSPHEALFHYCGDTLMAVRWRQYKLRYYTEQLPFDNFSTAHCQQGWADGEFFQGGWGCHGGSVTTNDPPELLNIASDPSERFPLVGKEEWLAYRHWRDGSSVDSHADGSADGSSTGGCSVNASLSRDFAQVEFSGFLSHRLPANATRPENEQRCAQLCCDNNNQRNSDQSAGGGGGGTACVAGLYQSYSRNDGIPKGACSEGQPCCWLISPDKFASGGKKDAETVNITIAVVGAVPHPPPPPKPTAPTPVPAPPGPGPYAGVLSEIERIVSAHTAAMVRETLPAGGAGKKSVAPCCDPPNCHCNYPGNPP